MFEMVGTPNGGRTFAGERRVRLGDCSPGGRLRLDASARYLQDLSDDDTRDAGFAQMTWVVRRTVIDVLRFPVYLEAVDMLTWCSGMGSRWAERRVDIASAGGGALSSATLWVHLDPATLRPAPLTDQFHRVFAASAAGRSVSTRLSFGGPPDDVDMTPWPARFVDFDVMEHMNNAVAFVVVEEALASRRELRAPLRVVVEYRNPIDRGVRLRCGGIDRDDGYDGWLVDEHGDCPVAYQITRLAG
ncbi:MAG: acyl-[acyl-carrier-protein] thioesterase [Ilumatobacteraceae bacterium]